MSDNCEPWDNSYVLDGETEMLLRKLLVNPLTDGQVVRSCIKQVGLLLSPDDEAKIKTKMCKGAAGLLGLNLQPFSEAIGEWGRMREGLQQAVEWEDVPEKEREMSERRANYILRYASDNGWIRRGGENGEWEISEEGRAKIEEGFNMR